MKLTERIVTLSDLVLSEEQNAVRSSGVHVSSVIRHIEETLSPKRGNTFTDDDMVAFATIGRLWEAQLAMAKFTPPRYERVGEVEMDGIIGSPDAIDTQEWAVCEFKARWASSDKPIEDVTKYWRQIKSYCHMLGMCRASLWVLYVKGNYKSPAPVPKAWDVLFTPAELQDNWKLIVTNAKALR